MGHPSMSSTYDAIVVGAGIVGAACALEAAQAGLRVAIIEPAVIGGGATAAGMGHIVVMDDSEAQFALTHYSRELWQALRPELAAEVEYDACGTLWFAADAEEMAEVERKAAFFRERGVRVEVLDAHALHEAEPNLRPDLVGALLVTDDAVVYPPAAARQLIQAVQQRGGVLLHGRRVVKISEPEAAKARLQLDDGSHLDAHWIINAAGAWAVQLTPGLEIKPRKGHLVITDRYPAFVHHQLVELGYLKSAHAMTAESVACNIQPRRTGQILIGSSRQFGATDPATEPQMIQRMLQRACSFMPGLAHLTALRTWTGFRAATPDKLPLIGPALGHERVYLATGHEGLGITTSLGTAKLVIDQMLKRESAIAAAPYLPSRNLAEIQHD